MSGEEGGGMLTRGLLLQVPALIPTRRHCGELGLPVLNRRQQHSFHHSQGLSSPAPLPQAEQAPRVSEQPRELDLNV